MTGVNGIGGFFFAAKDPALIGSWYEQVLGVLQPPTTYDDQPWHQDAGPTVFAAFPAGEEGPHIGPSGWGLNFRVDDLDAAVTAIRDQGIEVEVDPEAYPNGRFAQLNDPEGNPVQLWEAI